jgi:hypothetical protein
MIFTLLSLGSKSINTPDTSGCTPLQSSLIFSGTKTTKLLIQHGASLDVLIDESITNIFEADFSVTNLKILKLVGVEYPMLPAIFGFAAPDITKYILSPVVEDDAAKQRYEIYFQRSLARRLLFEAKCRRNRE